MNFLEIHDLLYNFVAQFFFPFILESPPIIHFEIIYV